MKFVADLHIHSKYARATSGRMEPATLALWGERKGVKVLGTGDFTHPLWLGELYKELEEAEKGLFRLKSGEHETRFVLSSEISCIYSKKGRVRKIHIVVLTPSFEEARGINGRLAEIGNLASDGRPILGLDAKKLVKIVFDECPRAFVIPAHIWTPWFSLFGSKSGFDSMEACFEEEAGRIKAVETGLSSDPPMNWRLRELDRVALVSNSDAHSPEKIGREANVLDTDLSYEGLISAIGSGDPEKFLFTIEFFPEEGRYHFDGHRKCGVSLSPRETEKSGGICPVCGKKVTVGVLSRVEELADRGEGGKPEGAVPFKNLIPLAEIISEALGVGVNTKTVEKEYERLLDVFSNELDILLEVERKELEKAAGSRIAEGVMRAREGKVKVKPGYDGVYGEVRLFGEEERKKDFSKQKNLFS